ncbi:mannonate dehydratase [Marinilongibacter aquaticus]|uniref:mannonate dehydratase n=1 Tax=Marinilongibacter aquaticus TaxID=2975157 RepID=UPI0021BD89B6|nr:mannonate dehydratase [Marinilongibacter aquaticus]UBM57231.1 mannonate dehydratase [Marinilongibacter aquaticus]
MKNDRRDFIRKSAAFTAAAAWPQAAKTNPQIPNKTSEYIKDAGMQLSLAYFWGIEPRKVALAKQMNVLGAVGGINPRMVNMNDKPNYNAQVIKAVKAAWETQGLQLKVIEGPPALYEKTKLGLPGRDEEIEQFIQFMKGISAVGIDTVCYNWMPVISWARTQTDRPSRGGALVSAFDVDAIQDEELITKYGELSHEKMWQNMTYFLKAVIPEAEKLGVKMALHPDDPPIDNIRGIPRIMTSVDAFKKLIDLVPSPSNGLTFCQGSFASMGGEGQGENIPEAIRYFGKKGLIHFVHFRDVKGYKEHFEEAFHDDGKTDMYEAMKAYYEVGFKGPIRPDHVPTMFGDSNEHAGYSTIGTLFAIGYIRGLIEGVSKA